MANCGKFRPIQTLAMYQILSELAEFSARYDEKHICLFLIRVLPVHNLPKF